MKAYPESNQALFKNPTLPEPGGSNRMRVKPKNYPTLVTRDQGPIVCIHLPVLSKESGCKIGSAPYSSGGMALGHKGRGALQCGLANLGSVSVMISEMTL